MNVTQQDKWKNSWYLKTGYVHNFICECGQVDRYIHIPSTMYHPDHSCSQCARSIYLDSVVFLNNEKVSRWLAFYWDYEMYEDGSGWHASATTKIPIFDYNLQKIIFTKIVIATANLSYAGLTRFKTHHRGIAKKLVYNNTNKITMIADILKDTVWDELNRFILSQPLDTIGWISSKMLQQFNTLDKTEALSFFLKHEYLKEIDFFFWDDFSMFKGVAKKHPSVEKMLLFIFNDREEKSIKRAYYKSYQIAIANRYNPKADYIFARVIKDRNFLLQCISIHHEIKNRLFDDVTVDDTFSFFSFLTKHYSERMITKIWTGITKPMVMNHIVRDTIRMFVNEPTDEHFIKPRADFNSIHDEFIRLNQLRKISLTGKVKFDYSHKELKAQVEIDRFSYFLPMTVYILDTWAKKLRNCMFGYAHAIHNKKSIIYGVFVDHTLSYAVEISGTRIVQALGVANQRISTEDRKIIDEWFRKEYLARYFELEMDT